MKKIPKLHTIYAGICFPFFFHFFFHPRKISKNFENEKTNLLNLLEYIDDKLAHIEDINADNRAVIVKLVTQSNQIVKFLKQVDIEVEEEVAQSIPDLSVEIEPINSNKIKSLKELLDEFMERKEGLKELEKELKKHKDQLTPGQVGEA